MDRTLNFAVIGCGLMGARHAETIQSTEDCRCVCLFDKIGAAAQALGKKLGVEVAGSYEDVLARKEVHAVVICLPSSLHADYGIQAAAAGKHVIVEKPIDISVEKAEALIAAAAKNGVLLTVISQNRFLEGSMALKKALDAGLLGEPLIANVSIKWFRDDAYYTKSDWRGRWDGEGGGVFMNQGIHYTDLLLWYLGEMEDARSLMATSRGIIETEDVGAILLRTRQGAIATITASTSAYPGFPERLELHCRKGSAILEQGKVVFWKPMDGRDLPEAAFAAPHPANLDAKLVPFQRQYRDLIEALRTGRPPLVTPQEALSVLKTILDAYACKF
jgi:predicted dehydrogenase